MRMAALFNFILCGGNVLNILYYDWKEFTGRDCREVMRELGQNVSEFYFDWKSIDMDEAFFQAAILQIDNSVKEGRPIDAVFSFNYFPVLAKAAYAKGVRYISWIFDSPHMPLSSESVRFDTNRIFIFDRGLFLKMQEEGIDTVRYMPLPVNGRRMLSLSKELDTPTPVIEHEVCFLGSLYDNEYNFYEEAEKYFPDELRGFCHGLFEAQQHLFGVNLINDKEALPDKKIAEIAKYMKFSLSGNYKIDKNQTIRDILSKKVTQLERKKLLESFGQKFKVDLYTQSYSAFVDFVYDLGHAEYYQKMPHIFHRSRINLNFTMRSIRTGIPLRAVDILSAGGFLLSGYQEELSEYFENGQEISLAMNPREMEELITYYLKPEHEKEREYIALNGQKKVIELFDYRVLLPQILNEK